VKIRESLFCWAGAASYSDEATGNCGIIGGSDSGKPSSNMNGSPFFFFVVQIG